ncbi:MAG: DNA polymerase III subunit beta [Endomicrobium sp.]|jgi:DNA polymerase-3 subunit beta|nr:DNA polymerase III subunit beta [Endomicrobium sp.]
MKVICGKDELMKGIQIVSPVASSKNTLPVLSNSLFETDTDKIKLSSTDLETAVQCYIKGEIVEEGAITIPAKRFADIIKELYSDQNIEINADDTNQINITSGRSKFNLMGIAQKEYPVIPKFPKDNNIIIKKDIFISMIKKTIFSVSKDAQRYILNGIYIIIEDNKLKMVSTDGRRLAYIEDNCIQTNIKGKAIVPSKAMADILRLLTSDVKSETIKLGLTNNQIALDMDGITFLSTLIEGAFPNYEQVIPQATDFKIKLNVKNTVAAVKQMALLTADKISSDRIASVKFYFSTNNLKISASTAGLGFGEVELEVEYSGEPVEINFNPNFVKEILQNVEEEFAVLEFKTAQYPAKISPENDKSYQCVVMPIRM